MQGYRSGCKNTQIFQKNLELENMTSKLSKNVSNVSLAPLVRILCLHVDPLGQGKKNEKMTFFGKIWKFTKFDLWIKP